MLIVKRDKRVQYFVAQEQIANYRYALIENHLKATNVYLLLSNSLCDVNKNRQIT